MFTTSVAEDQIILSVFEISIARVYIKARSYAFYSPLWQMTPYYRVSFATVILSDIISLRIFNGSLIYLSLSNLEIIQHFFNLEVWRELREHYRPKHSVIIAKNAKKGTKYALGIA